MGGDRIKLDVTLEEHSRLVLVTQGSTKIFKSPGRTVISAQTLNVTVGRGASVCYLPDPTQPFAESVYEQKQTFWVDPQGTSSLCVLDWVSEGRRARGESWTLWSWKGRNEVREHIHDDRGSSRLLLRDAVTLNDDQADATGSAMGITAKTNGLGVLGTLVLYGSTFENVGAYFLNEFNSLPRMGGKNWSDNKTSEVVCEEAKRRERRVEAEKADGVLWTAADSRGFVVIKFGAREVDGARRWLGDMIRREGSVEREFGHQALIGLR